jgi:hypothetical protein
MATSNSPDSDEKKRTLRASEFLKTGSDLAGKSGQSDHLYERQPQESLSQERMSQAPHENTASEPEQPAPPPQEKSKPRTGVVSSTIHYPAKQHSETETPSHLKPVSKSPATNTAPLMAAKAHKQTRTPLPAAEKQRKREEQVERMADKIVGLAEGLVLFKTGMLNPQLTPSQKVKLVAQRYPHFFKRFGKVFGWPDSRFCTR